MFVIDLLLTFPCLFTHFNLMKLWLHRTYYLLTSVVEERPIASNRRGGRNDQKISDSTRISQTTTRQKSYPQVDQQLASSHNVNRSEHGDDHESPSRNISRQTYDAYRSFTEWPNEKQNQRHIAAEAIGTLLFTFIAGACECCCSFRRSADCFIHQLLSTQSPRVF